MQGAQQSAGGCGHQQHVARQIRQLAFAFDQPVRLQRKVSEQVGAQQQHTGFGHQVRLKGARQLFIAVLW